MWGCSLVASRSVFCYNHRQLLGGSDPALSTAAWLHTATCYRCTCRSGLPPSPLDGSGTGAIIQFWDASVCLFVNHRLSSTVTPPTFPLRLRSGPLRQWLFWPRHPGTVISTTAAYTHRSSTCVCSHATGEGFCELVENFLWIHASVSDCEYTQQDHHWGCIDFFLSLPLQILHHHHQPPTCLQCSGEHWPWQSAGELGLPLITSRTVNKQSPPSSLTASQSQRQTPGRSLATPGHITQLRFALSW